MTTDQDDPLPPVLLYTPRSSYVTTVKRMKAEKERGIPISQRSHVAISAQNGKSAADMSEVEWENFYKTLCDVVKEDYPEQYKKIFGS